MALTPLRWIAALVALCLVGTMVILRVEPNDRRSYDFGPINPLEARRNSLSLQARQLGRRIRLARILDSTHAGSGKGVTEPVRVLIGSSVPIAARGALDSLTQRALRDVPGASRIGIDIFFVHDTATMLAGAQVTQYDVAVDWVLPRQSGDRCAVLVRFSNSPHIEITISRRFLSEAGAEQLLGPCKYYRAFGMPGKQIDLWLRTRGWNFAGDGSWSAAAMTVVRRPNLYFAPYVLTFDTRLFQVSVDGSNCERGDAAACTRVLIGPARRMTFVNGNVLRGSYGSFATRWDYYGEELGSRETFLFADMVRTIGREKFGQFWTSAESPPAAFQSVTGESMGEWTSHWIATQYGPPPGRGPSLGAWGALASTMLVVLGVFVGIRVNAHRQFA